MKARRVKLTLNGVGLGQLSEVGKKCLGDVIPCVSLAETQVDVSTGELVHVELVFVSTMGNMSIRGEYSLDIP